LNLVQSVLSSDIHPRHHPQTRFANYFLVDKKRDRLGAKQSQAAVFMRLECLSTGVPFALS
jgi:hypothetical protein